MYATFQCAKLLADVSVIQFYPSKFVLITDILDTFGELFLVSRDKCLSVLFNMVICNNIVYTYSFLSYWTFYYLR